MFPANDNDFEDVTIAEVRAEEKGGGWSIKRSDGWSFWVPKDSRIAPAVGMAARFYGKGIGYPVRGMFLDGQQVFYRTEAEHRQHDRDERYGKSAADLVAKWDRGDTIWSITLGGFGPGYEQALQIAAVEIARDTLTSTKPADEADVNAWWRALSDPAIERVDSWGNGLSGAQAGVARWLAFQWVHGEGPTLAEGHERAIQVSRHWPRASATDGAQEVDRG